MRLSSVPIALRHASCGTVSPTISIEQKAASKNPRSTVGTITEVYDYLRLLFARAGRPHCPGCGRPIERQTVQQIVDAVSVPVMSFAAAPVTSTTRKPSKVVSASKVEIRSQRLTTQCWSMSNRKTSPTPGRGF